MTIFYAILTRDIQNCLKNGGGIMAVLSLPFILFVLGFSQMWLGFLLAVLLSLPNLYEEDTLDGTLDYLIIAPIALELALVAKLIAHWLVFIVPLIPLVMLLTFFSIGSFEVNTLASYFFASIGLVLVGNVGAALTATATRSGGLLFLLVMPLYLPILIFASADNAGSLAFLVALDLGLAVPAIWIASTALKLSK